MFLQKIAKDYKINMVVLQKQYLQMTVISMTKKHWHTPIHSK